MTQHVIPALLLLSMLLIVIAGVRAEESLPIDLATELEPMDEFPVPVDSLEEFIQSYYALLDSETYIRQFGFIDQNANVIHNAAPRLNSFFGKLMRLRNGDPATLTIFQIGDSHIKPGYLSTTTRTSLLKFFEPDAAWENARLRYQFFGVNGASYYNLTPNEKLFSRCRELKPDLVVISLGTNDAQGNYNADNFRKSMRNFMAKLNAAVPDAIVLFTLPPDSVKKGTHNPDVPKVGAEIIDYAIAQGYAWWDMYAVMGGKNSIKEWFRRDLASKDKVHFSPQGYMLQGSLFYHALMHGYKRLSEGNN
jgi:lysophospholipase L1-like esterase